VWRRPTRDEEHSGINELLDVEIHANPGSIIRGIVRSVASEEAIGLDLGDSGRATPVSILAFPAFQNKSHSQQYSHTLNAIGLSLTTISAANYNLTQERSQEKFRGLRISGVSIDFVVTVEISSLQLRYVKFMIDILFHFYNVMQCIIFLFFFPQT